MSIVIKRYPDMTTPTPAYGGRVKTCFSPKAWKHFIVKEDGTLDPLAGVTGVLKKAVDKSQVLMRWAVKVALQHAKTSLLHNMGPDGCIQVFVDELNHILDSAKRADSDALGAAGEVGHQAHGFIDDACKAIIAKDVRRLEELFSAFPEDEKAENGAIAALTFLVKHNVRIVKSEFRCLSLKHKCCGTGDMLGLVDSCGDPGCCPEPFTDRLSYLDWKTSNGLYVTYLWQASLYVAATEEEFPELGPIVDRWILRLDKDDASFDPWHAAGPEAQAQDLHGFLCCLDMTRAMDTTQARIDEMLDIRKEIRSEAKALDKATRDKIECSKSKTYQGKRKSKCLPDGSQCLACTVIWENNH